MAARLLPPVQLPGAPPDAAMPDPVESAKAAGLRYVSDGSTGIRRRKAGKGFSYVDPDGKPVKDKETLARIRRLAIPPAWTEVWVCPQARGHLQATGRDARGRKQYRYHPEWRQARDETKYSRMVAFGQALPGIRARVERDVALPGLPREKVLATIVRLLETTYIRVGNEEYAKANRSYGLTTLRTQHVDVEGPCLRFRFRGKAGKVHEVDVEDPRLARIVRKCQDLPGQELFRYLDGGGEPRTLSSQDVNDYLREVSGQDFTAKDFRTWAGTVLAAMALREMAFGSETEAKRNLVRAVEEVAGRLGNTPAICRRCYVHPHVLDAYLDGTLGDSLRRRVAKEVSGGLKGDEAAVLGLLAARLEVEARAGGRLPAKTARSVAAPKRRRRQ